MKQLDTITFQRIETFFTVAESKSFSVAAEKLHMSQSAISKIIASMEEKLEVDLFKRNYHKLELTDAGKILFDGWRPMLHSMERIYNYEFMNRIRNS